jgi:hypothetical protein
LHECNGDVAPDDVLWLWFHIQFVVIGYFSLFSRRLSSVERGAHDARGDTG